MSNSYERRTESARTTPDKTVRPACKCLKTKDIQAGKNLRRQGDLSGVQVIENKGLPSRTAPALLRRVTPFCPAFPFSGPLAGNPGDLLKQIGHVLYGEPEGFRGPGMRLIPVECLLRAMVSTLKAEIGAADASCDIATAAVRLAELLAVERAIHALADGEREARRAVDVFGMPGAAVEGAGVEGTGGGANA